MTTYQTFQAILTTKILITTLTKSMKNKEYEPQGNQDPQKAFSSSYLAPNTDATFESSTQVRLYVGGALQWRKDHISRGH